MIGDPLDLSRPPDVGGRVVTEIHLHHEGGGDELDSAEDIERAALSRGVGFASMPYHIVVRRGSDELGPDGAPVLGVNLWRAVQGRPLDQQPASVKGRNAHAVAVVVAGAWHEAPLPRYAEDVLVAVCEWLCESLGLPAAAIVGHRELAPTLCPGYDPEAIRRRVRARLGG